MYFLCNYQIDTFFQPSFGHEYVTDTGPKSLSTLATRPKSQNDQVKSSPQKVKGNFFFMGGGGSKNVG